MFAFFSRWKRASRAVGVTSGTGKLCKFDKDGNVVSSGISPDDIPTPTVYYMHYVSLSDDTNNGTFYIQIINKSVDSINTFEKLWNALNPAVPQPATGWFYHSGSTTRTTIMTVQKSGNAESPYIEAVAPLHTGETQPMTFDFDPLETYDPSDYVTQL